MDKDMDDARRGWLDLPVEIILLIVSFLEFESELNSLSQTHSRLYEMLNPLLYQREVRSGDGYALIWAAAKGVEPTVCKLLKGGVAASAGALGAAARYGHTTIAAWLLDHGADPTAEGEWSDLGDEEEPLIVLSNLVTETALNNAAEYGRTPILRLFIEHIGPNGVATPDGLLTRALFKAAYKGQLSAVQALLDAGCDINGVDRKGRNLVHRAALSGSPSTLKFLVQQGVDVNAESATPTAEWEKACPLVLAVWYGHAEQVEILLDHGANIAPFTITPDDPEREMQMPVRWSHDHSNYFQRPALNKLLDKSNYAQVLIASGQETRLLCLAAFGDRPDLVQELIDKGCDPNAPLRGVEKNKPINWAIRCESVGVVRVLLPHVPHAHLFNMNGGEESLLQQAVVEGNEQIVTMILECASRTDRDAISSKLRLAVGSDLVLQLFLDYRADPTWDEHSVFALLPRWVLECGTAAQVQLLLDRGFDFTPFLTPGWKRTRRLEQLVRMKDADAKLALLVGHGFDPQPSEYGDGVAFEEAVSKGHLQLLQLLINKGFNLHGRDWEPSLLFRAATGARDSVAPAIVDLLLRNSVNINALGRDSGKTALMETVEAHDPQGVRLLLERGANVLISNGVGQSALTTAVALGNIEIIRPLFEAMRAQRYSPQELRPHLLVAEEQVCSQLGSWSWTWDTDETPRRVRKLIRKFYWRTLYPV